MDAIIVNSLGTDDGDVYRFEILTSHGEKTIELNKHENAVHLWAIRPGDKIVLSDTDPAFVEECVSGN